MRGILTILWKSVTVVIAIFLLVWMMGQAAALVSSASTVGVLFGVTLAIVTIVLAYALVFMVWLKWLMPVLFKQVEKTMRSL